MVEAHGSDQHRACRGRASRTGSNARDAFCTCRAPQRATPVRCGRHPPTSLAASTHGIHRAVSAVPARCVRPEALRVTPQPLDRQCRRGYLAHGTSLLIHFRLCRLRRVAKMGRRFTGFIGGSGQDRRRGGTRIQGARAREGARATYLLLVIDGVKAEEMLLAEPGRHHARRLCRAAVARVDVLLRRRRSAVPAVRPRPQRHAGRGGRGRLTTRSSPRRWRCRSFPRTRPCAASC